MREELAIFLEFGLYLVCSKGVLFTLYIISNFILDEGGFGEPLHAVWAHVKLPFLFHTAELGVVLLHLQVQAHAIQNNLEIFQKY